MVKLYCDRCGKEIKEEYYYTIHIHKNETVTKTYVFDEYATTAPNFNSSLDACLLAKLNSIDIFCEECKEQIEACICNCNYRYL